MHLQKEANNTNAPLEIYNYLDKLPRNKGYLQYHQYVVNQYFINFPHARGLLVQHPPGTGKTILAASLGVHFAEQDKKVIILTAKALQDNFKQGVLQYISNSDTKIGVDDFSYLSLNANNILDQMGNIGRSAVDKKFEKLLGETGDIIRETNKLNDALLIVDEAHNLSNGVSNGSKNAVGLYDLILKAKNLKLILLTGTPIVNDPFELGILFNMVRGYIYDGKIGTTLFPEIRSEFNEYFIDFEKMTIKNGDKFINRAYGLSTYYGPYGRSDVKQKGYPTEYKLIIERVPMSAEQFSRYDTARIKEREEIALGFQSSQNIRFEKRSGNSTYRIASRQISNYSIPMYAMGEERGKKAREKYIDKINAVDLKNLNKFSPKFKKIIENINKHEGIQVIYSDFVRGEGINLFARVLNTLGYQEWVLDKGGGDWFSYVGGKGIYENDIVDPIICGGKSKKYVIITGNVLPENRTKILEYVNHTLNKLGHLVNLVLISGVLSQGISIFRARAIHIMSPTWNYALILQIIARTIRYLSHEDLPVSKRTVQPYIYLSDYPIGYKESWDRKNKELTDQGTKPEEWEDTTDVTLFCKSIAQKRLNDYFIAASIRASVDCNIYTKTLSVSEKKRINCLMCHPTNESLYSSSIPSQLKFSNKCLPYKPGTKIKAKQIVIDLDGHKETFYYTYDKPTKQITVLTYDRNLDGYVPLNHDHVHYHDIYNILEEKLL